MRPPPVLVTPAEEGELEAALLEALRENRQRRCLRPVLRHEALLGHPDPLLVALVEPEGALVRCVEAVERAEREWRRAFVSPAQGVLPRLHQGAPPPAERGGVSLASACDTLPEAIGRAVRFASACSPYLPGRRRLPRLVPLVRLLMGAALLALARSGADPLGAAFLLLESLRLQQDLCRGGVPWIWPFVLREPLRMTVAVLASLLASGRIRDEALGALEAALKVLSASEPTPESHLRGEQLTVELGSYLVPLMPSGWVPPGGEPTPGFNPGAGVPHRALGSPRQDLLLAWLAHRQRSEQWIRGCSPRAAPARCLEALEAFHQEVRERVRHLAERWRDLGQRLDEALGKSRAKGPDAARARNAVIEWLVALGPTTTADHLRRAGERPYWLAALRIHAAVLGAQAGTAQPITPGQVLDLPAARRDPFWGEPFAIQGEPGALELRPPRSLSPAHEAPLVYFMAWPVPGDRGSRPLSRPGSP